MAIYKQLASCLIATTAFAVVQGAGAVGLPDVPSNVHTDKQLGNTTSFNEALKSGTPDLVLRLRYENVSDDIPSTNSLAGTDDAEQWHLRTALGYSTMRYHGFYARVQFEAGTRIGSDKALNLDEDVTFPAGLNNSRIAEGYSLIPDNEFQEINNAYIGWRSAASGCPNTPGGCNGPTTIKLGRQAIIYDNHRWVGNIVWRQNEQTYDAVRIDNTSIPNLNISYAFIDRVNRTFGEDSAFNRWEMGSSHLINVAYMFPFGKLVGYGYLLDFKDNPKTPFVEGTGTAGVGAASYDSDTWGLRFVGKHKISDAFALLSELEWARQKPTNDAGPTLTENDYYNFEFGGAFKVAGKPVVVKVGQEVLGSNGVNAVQTPLATFHAFNGWADKFVGAPGGTATPVGGLEDTSATVVVQGLFGGKLIFQYHDYQADKVVSGLKDYGTEWGVQYTRPFAKNWLGLVKYADFNDGGDGFSFDTQKYWVSVQYAFE